MDSLPTGSTQSLLIVVTIAFSPVIVLFLADAVGWLIRQARAKGGRNYGWSGTKRGPPMSSARTGVVGTVIGAFIPLSPVAAFLIVIAAAGRARRYCASGLARRVG